MISCNAENSSYAALNDNYSDQTYSANEKKKNVCGAQIKNQVVHLSTESLREEKKNVSKPLGRA